MSTAGLQAANKQNAKELDSMKESISDIINQLQDIDPTRLSFSPFLDLDTQISLAPVSDSPESSVEELHSSSQSLSGSQHSLEQPPATSRTRGSTPHHQQAVDHLQEESRVVVVEAKERDPDASSPNVVAERSADATAENGAPPAPRGNLPNGVNATRRGPESTGVDCTADEDRPLISPPPDSVELAVWDPEGRAEPREAPPGPPRHGRCCCQCKCCLSGRVPAFLSILASLLCAAGICYALYFHVPIKPPDCPDPASRVVFALCCCVVASVPVLLAMLTGAACQFCTASFSPRQTSPAAWALQQLYVAATLQQLVLYILNLVVMAALLPQDQLKLVPILVTLFICGRLVYWLSLNVCSSWRGFGSGLTVFPLLAVVGLNLFLMYSRNLKEPLLGSRDVLYNQVTPSNWSGEASQSPSGTADILPTDILDAQ